MGYVPLNGWAPRTHWDFGQAQPCKKKLQEWQALDAEDARQAAIEAKQDVRKKDNMDSFYVNLMHDNVSMGNMLDKVNPVSPDGDAEAAGRATRGEDAAGARNGRGVDGSGGDGDGIELGIAGGTQMTFESAIASKEEATAATWGEAL